jgi:serine/threonine protein kinase
MQVLATCHSRGVLHGDLKPENIMISHRGAIATVIDFGTASLWDGMHPLLQLLYVLVFVKV